MKHYLTLCAIFKDEADHLEEWLRFYDLVGVDRFVLYDNGSTDRSREILQPWIAAGRVKLYAAPEAYSQLDAYRHSFQAHGPESRWMMVVDVDEFLFSPQEPDLRNFLSGYENEVAVVANWLMFGANGHRTKAAGLTTLNFNRRCQTNLCTFERGLLKNPQLDPSDPASYHPVCAHVKSIVNCEAFVEVVPCTHYFAYKGGRHGVNANRKIVEGAFSDDLTAVDLLRINHYFSRSWEELERKLRRGRSDISRPYDYDGLVKRNALFDEVVDETIFPLAHRVQAAMQM